MNALHLFLVRNWFSIGTWPFSSDQALVVTWFQYYQNEKRHIRVRLTSIQSIIVKQIPRLLPLWKISSYTPSWSVEMVFVASQLRFMNFILVATMLRNLNSYLSCRGAGEAWNNWWCERWALAFDDAYNKMVSVPLWP